MCISQKTKFRRINLSSKPPTSSNLSQIMNDYRKHCAAERLRNSKIRVKDNQMHKNRKCISKKVERESSNSFEATNNYINGAEEK